MTTTEKWLRSRWADARRKADELAHENATLRGRIVLLERENRELREERGQLSPSIYPAGWGGD